MATGNYRYVYPHRSEALAFYDEHTDAGHKVVGVPGLLTCTCGSTFENPRIEVPLTPMEMSLSRFD